MRQIKSVRGPVVPDGAMKTDLLKALGLFDARVPRYTSYPPATVFSTAVDGEIQAHWMGTLDPATPVSVYVHIPFCERLCWFCACRTQGTQSLAPVERYLATLRTELALVAAHLPKGLRMGRLHWGGGTPTILLPDMIRTLAQVIFDVLPPAEPFEFSVEIDPTLVDCDKIDALADMGMTRASIGIQDFDPLVQGAIGRDQSFEATRDCVTLLRAAGISSLNADLVYGLPHQTADRMAATLDQVLSLAPERIALFGYAHVPHMAKRQKLIDEKVLPDDVARHALAMQAAARFLRMSESKVYGVASFYSQFYFSPRGRNTLTVCRGTACHVRGSGRLLNDVQKHLGVEPGQATEDLSFSLETVACFGACALAPVVVLNGQVHRQQTPVSLRRLVDRTRAAGKIKTTSKRKKNARKRSR